MTLTKEGQVGVIVQFIAVRNYPSIIKQGHQLHSLKQVGGNKENFGAGRDEETEEVQVS